MIGKIRYIVLAATLLSTLALPQWTRASDTRNGAGTIILAQAVNPNDPKAKAKQQPQQQPKGPPPGTPQGRGQPPGPPPAIQQGRGQPPGPPPGVGQQTPPGQPKVGTTTPPNQPPPQYRTGRGQPPGGQPGVGQQAPPQGPQGQPRIGTVTPPTPPPGAGPQQKGPYYRVVPQPGTPGAGQPQTPPSPPGRQIGRPGPGVAPPPRYVNVEQLRTLRQERIEGNRRVFVEPGNRFIVREGNRMFVRHNEAERFRRWDPNARFERRGGETFTYFRRPGYEIIDVTGSDGRLLRRIRRGYDGREIVLIDNRPYRGATTFFLALPPPIITIPRERYIVDVDGAPPALLYDTLEAEPVVPIERAYSLDEIRYNAPLRDRLTRLDLNTVTFDTGSWEITPDQAEKLAEVAAVIQRILEGKPNEIFLIEGHTDAVGNDVDNLSLSDRRAESVAAVLTESYEIPPENLTTQGYGSQFLKVPTQGPSRENRRVAIRRITPLLMGQAR